MAGTSSLTMEQRLLQLQKANEIAQPHPSKIQRVAHHLRDRKHFAKHYCPKLLSLGPIHHGAPKLQLGENYKQIWAAKYIESTGQTPQVLHHRVATNFENLKKLFEDDLLTQSAQRYQDQGFGTMEEKICWMLLVDGCALLQILEHANLDNENQQQMNVKIDQLVLVMQDVLLLENQLLLENLLQILERAKLENQQQMNVTIDQLVLVMQDVLLLENQLPFPLLKLLWKNDDERGLMRIMKQFLRCHHWASTRAEHKVNIETTEFPSPTHLLDFQRSIILYERPNNKKENRTRKGPIENLMQSCTNVVNDPDGNSDNMVTYRNIKELKEAGIRLKSSKTRRPRDVSFYHGWFCSELKLPEIVVDDTTVATVLNLIAYEMCPDFENDYGICSYVSFLDSLIDHPDDVKELRSKGILLNSLGSDEEVANLFNTLSTDLVPDSGK